MLNHDRRSPTYLMLRPAAMTDGTPPPRLLVETFAACAAPRSATYCSAPITSGRRNFAWLRKIGKSFATIDDASADDRVVHAREVVAANCNHARTVVERLRKEQGGVVIDPTAFPPIADWTQQQWIEFWSSVIERFACRVVFVDDWQYSNGCTQEFLVAVALALPTFTEAGEQLTLELALRLIQEAISEVGAFGGSTELLESVTAELRRRTNGGASDRTPRASGMAN